MSPSRYDWRDFAATTNEQVRAMERRPTERAALLREILRLKAAGLKIRDVAETLGLNPSAIETLIESEEPGSGVV